MIHLGVPGFEPLPFIKADPAAWSVIDRRLRSSVFLRSEGTVVTVGTPQIATLDMSARCAELARRFDRFYARVAATYYTRPDLNTEFLANPLFQPLFDLEREQTDGHRSVASIARFDCVIATDGSIRVIELNPVGVNLLHVRSLLYVMHTLERRGLHREAGELATLSRAVVDGFVTAFKSRHRAPPGRRLVVGGLMPKGWFRATQLLYRQMFLAAGVDYVYGGPDTLDISGATMRLAGKSIDILWPDYLFYMAYQEARYSQTKFPSKIGDYSSTPEQVAALLSNPRFLEHLRTGQVVMLSPAAAYLALPKSLLAWIHDPEMPAVGEDRGWLAERVARTYSVRDRHRALSIDAVIAEKERFLIKPCQYGGSHGVLLGPIASTDEWTRGVRAMWEDPTWVVQDYWEPVRTAGGNYVSLGVQSFSGALGGIYLRTAASPLVAARSSDFIPVVTSPSL